MPYHFYRKYRTLPAASSRLTAHSLRPVSDFGLRASDFVRHFELRTWVFAGRSCERSDTASSLPLDHLATRPLDTVVFPCYYCLLMAATSVPKEVVQLVERFEREHNDFAFRRERARRRFPVLLLFFLGTSRALLFAAPGMADSAASWHQTVLPGTRLATLAVNHWFSSPRWFKTGFYYGVRMPLAIDLRAELGVARRLSLGAELELQTSVGTGDPYFPLPYDFGFGPALTWHLPVVLGFAVPYLGATGRVVYDYWSTVGASRFEGHPFWELQGKLVVGPSGTDWTER